MHRSVVLNAFMVAAFVPLSAPTQTEVPTAEFPTYWQVSCTEGHSPATAGVYVELRRTGMTKEVLELPSRVLTFWEGGFQEHGVDGRWNLPWPEIQRVSVRKIGVANPAWALSVASRNKSFGSRELGAVELVCWRLIERMVNCHAPSTVEGSPPLNRPPLHDSNGNIVPEPTYPDPFCPNQPPR